MTVCVPKDAVGNFKIVTDDIDFACEAFRLSVCAGGKILGAFRVLLE